MKKIVALFLVLAMLFALAACGKNNESGETGSTNGNNQTGETENTGDNTSASKTDYKSAVELFANAKYGLATDELVNLVPEAYWQFYELSGMPRSSLVNEAKYAVEQTFGYYSEAFGASFAIAVEINEATGLSASELADIAGLLAEQKGIQTSDVSAAYTIKATLTFTGTSTATEELETNAVMIGDNWYCVGWQMYDGGGYIFFELEDLPEYG